MKQYAKAKADIFCETLESQDIGNTQNSRSLVNHISGGFDSFLFADFENSPNRGWE